MRSISVPLCGSSDKRNDEYEKQYTPKIFYSSIIDHDKPVIFDVGAHHGESVVFYKSIFPDSIIYSFEPDSDNYHFLKDTCALFADNCFAYNFAMDVRGGKKTFYKQSLSHLGGLSPINCESKDSIGYAENAENRAIVVEAQSLDEFCQKNGIHHIDLLKIDVQGCEVDVLKGGCEILSNVSVCQLEVSLYDFYEKSSSLLDIELIMRDSGLALWDIAKISKNPKTLRTDWAELIYKKMNK